METPTLEQPEPQMPQTLSPCSSGRRSIDSNSPEFEFWMVRNPSFPQPNLVSADELFVDGVLIPLHLLQHHHNSGDPPDPHPSPPSQETASPTLKPPPESEPDSGPDLSTAPPDSTTPALTASKRWKDIFKKSDRKNSHSNNNEDKEKEKKKDRKSGAGNGASSAELNINIWPFSRSRSAGNGPNRPRMVAGSAATRKVSSAPCSRSNSAGESKSRKWPSSPSRAGGVHLGRSSPVWQVRRGGLAGRISEQPVVRNAERSVKKEGNKAAAAGGGAKPRVLNAPTCIGYRHHLSCRSEENSAVGVAPAVSAGGAGVQNGGGGSGAGGRGGNLFNLRSLFTKKVY